MSSMDCDAHGWNFEPGDSCPVCDGMDLERERIVALIGKKITEAAEDVRFPPDEDTQGAFIYAYTLSGIIALIKGETT